MQEGALRRRFVEYGEIHALSEADVLERVDPEHFWPYVEPQIAKERFRKFGQPAPVQPATIQTEITWNSTIMPKPCCSCLIDYGKDCPNCAHKFI